MKQNNEEFKILEPLNEVISKKFSEFCTFSASRNVWKINENWQIKTKSKKIEEKFVRLIEEIESLRKIKDMAIKQIKYNRDKK